MENLPEEKNYCRKCQKILPYKDFYEAVDCGFIDSNGYMSVCKSCIQNIYDELFEKLQSMEKAIHKLCTSLNLRYSNEAVSAARTHIETLLSNGKNVNAIFGIYKMKLVATKKTMDKSKEVDQTYEDIATIYTKEPIDTDKAPVPEEVITFWGEDLPLDDIRFLEREYKNFKKTHAAETYAQIILIKEVCYTLLQIKQARRNEESISDIKKLEDTLDKIMGSLAITPKEETRKDNKDVGEETFGLWIRDIEEKEPAQWLSTDPRGDMYRDVGNVEKYFQDYFVRPMKNFITMSKDFSIDEESMTDEDAFIAEYDEDIVFTDLDDEQDNNENGNEEQDE